jgi:hypothetical protein
MPECYNRFPQSSVRRELREYSITRWQNEWDATSKGATTKSFFPLITDRLKQKINVTSNFTTMLTGHGNIKSYLHKFKIIDDPMCVCKNGEQTIDHILYDCELMAEERDKLKVAVLRQEDWSVRKDVLISKYGKDFKEFTDSISLNNIQ